MAQSVWLRSSTRRTLPRGNGLLSGGALRAVSSEVIGRAMVLIGTNTTPSTHFKENRCFAQCIDTFVAELGLEVGECVVEDGMPGATFVKGAAANVVDDYAALTSCGCQWGFFVLCLR